MPAADKQVLVGETTHHIRRFRGFKAVRAGRIMARITDEVPKIIDAMAAFTSDYESKHTLRISRAMAASGRFEQLGITEESFGDGETVVEVPQSPSQEEQIIAVLPKIIELAEHEVVELLALIVAPNDALRKADEEDDVDGYLQRLGKDLLFEGDLDQLADVVIAAREMLVEQFSGKLEALRLLWAYRQGVNSSPTAAAAPKETEAKSTSSPSSSTSSPEPTAGPEDTSSSASPGASLSAMAS